MKSHIQVLCCLILLEIHLLLLFDCCCLVTKSYPTLCDSMDCSTPGLHVHNQLKSIESVMPSNHLIFCCPLFLLPSVFSSIRVFSSLSALCIRWPKCWSFSISPSNEYSGLISFRVDWFDLLAVQGIPKSLLQHHSSKASNLYYCNGEGKKKGRTSQHCFLLPELWFLCLLASSPDPSGYKGICFPAGSLG